MHPHVVYMFTYENFVAIIVLFYPKNKKMSTAVCDGWSKDSLLVILHDFDAIYIIDIETNIMQYKILIHKSWFPN